MNKLVSKTSCLINFRTFDYYSVRTIHSIEVFFFSISLSPKFGNLVDVLLFVIDMIFGQSTELSSKIYETLLSFATPSIHHSFSFLPTQSFVQLNENCVNTIK